MHKITTHLKDEDDGRVFLTEVCKVGDFFRVDAGEGAYGEEVLVRTYADPDHYQFVSVHRPNHTWSGSMRPYGDRRAAGPFFRGRVLKPGEGFTITVGSKLDQD